MIRVSSTASANRLGSSPNPGASSLIRPGVKASASARSATWLTKRSVNTRSPKSLARSGPSCWCMRA